MSDYQPKPWHRVKVTRSWIGTVSPDGGFVRTEHGFGVEIRITALPGTFFEQSVERLPDPELQWQPGDVVRAADGHTYARRAVPTFQKSLPWVRLSEKDPAVIVTYTDDEVPRPLTPLVRDGKPWDEQ